jgi:hypothetical protein
MARAPDGLRDNRELRTARDTGENWHVVSQKTRIPYATVKKHARAMGYERRRREPLGRRNSSMVGG